MAFRTWIVHVSSELNSTMGSPPLAISTLFCGRNRATTVAPHSQQPASCPSVPRVAGLRTFYGVGAPGGTKEVSFAFTVPAPPRSHLRHGLCKISRVGPAALAGVCSLALSEAARRVCRVGGRCFAAGSCRGTLTQQFKARRVDAIRPRRPQGRTNYAPVSA